MKRLWAALTGLLSCANGTIDIPLRWSSTGRHMTFSASVGNVPDAQLVLDTGSSGGAVVLQEACDRNTHSHCVQLDNFADRVVSARTLCGSGVSDPPRGYVVPLKSSTPVVSSSEASASECCQRCQRDAQCGAFRQTSDGVCRRYHTAGQVDTSVYLEGQTPPALEAMSLSQWALIVDEESVLSLSAHPVSRVPVRVTTVDSNDGARNASLHVSVSAVTHLYPRSPPSNAVQLHQPPLSDVHGLVGFLSYAPQAGESMSLADALLYETRSGYMDFRWHTSLPDEPFENSTLRLFNASSTAEALGLMNEEDTRGLPMQAVRGYSASDGLVRNGRRTFTVFVRDMHVCGAPVLDDTLIVPEAGDVVTSTEYPAQLDSGASCLRLPAPFFDSVVSHARSLKCRHALRDDLYAEHPARDGRQEVTHSMRRQRDLLFDPKKELVTAQYSSIYLGDTPLPTLVPSTVCWLEPDDMQGEGDLLPHLSFGVGDEFQRQQADANVDLSGGYSKRDPPATWIDLPLDALLLDASDAASRQLTSLVGAPAGSRRLCMLRQSLTVAAESGAQSRRSLQPIALGAFAMAALRVASGSGHIVGDEDLLGDASLFVGGKFHRGGRYGHTHLGQRNGAPSRCSVPRVCRGQQRFRAQQNECDADCSAFFLYAEDADDGVCRLSGSSTRLVVSVIVVVAVAEVLLLRTRDRLVKRAMRVTAADVLRGNEGTGLGIVAAEVDNSDEVVQRIIAEQQAELARNSVSDTDENNNENSNENNNSDNNNSDNNNSDSDSDSHSLHPVSSAMSLIGAGEDSPGRRSSTGHALEEATTGIRTNPT